MGVLIWKSSEILRGEVIENFEGDEQDFVRNAIFIGDPLKILQDGLYDGWKEFWR